MLTNKQKNSYFLPIFFVGIFCIFLGMRSLYALSDPKFINALNQSDILWMHQKIEKDLKPYRNQTIFLTKMSEDFAQKKYEGLFLVKFTILNGQVFVEENLPEHLKNMRSKPIKNALEKLCQLIPIPNITFFASMHDGLLPAAKCPYDFPLFVMSKDKREERYLLFPDYESLGETYQVWPNQNMEKTVLPWSAKRPYLIWRAINCLIKSIHIA